MVAVKHHFRGQCMKGTWTSPDAPGASRATPGDEKALLPLAPAIVCQPARSVELPPCDLDILDCIHFGMFEGQCENGTTQRLI